ncbi:hypothetical protein OJ997_11860 [Solirubrobacter phytolaccae]|uniref:Uncharacterized protein n=1 Tax=Solirubrobacter phytolaccae TaxID=1404360 RepID=A0A9X3S833_9ACTN|nr:hypothetical protein [Solirubrobacter phytolaccae]MDA0180993.1 hypothetical protein [Solirubrobacter phytolaccae]
MAAISPSPRRRRQDLPQWAGTVGMALGTALGGAACYGLALLL